MDYPNSNAGSNAAAHRAYMDQNLQAPSFTPPGAPNYPLADMETNLKREADYYTQKGRDTTSHAPNIGVGPWPLPWSQVFFNSTTIRQPG